MKPENSIPIVLFLWCLFFPYSMNAQPCEVTPALPGWTIPLCDLSVSFSVDVTFNPPSQNIVQWDFGDGSPLQNNGNHTYALAGTYQVCVTAMNMQCSDTYCQSITVNDGAPDFDNCPGSAVLLIVDDPLNCTNETYLPNITARRCGSILSADVTCTRSDGELLTDPWPMGATATTVICTATDPSNGLQAVCEWEVIVETNEFNLSLQSYAEQEDLSEMCPGEPLIFNMDSPVVGSGAYNVLWEYEDNGDDNWIAMAGFESLTFTLPAYSTADEAWFDCSAPDNTDGFLDRTFRATVTTTTPAGDMCVHHSEEYSLRLCCPITDASVQVVPGAPLCEGDMVDLTASLVTTHPFLNPPGSEITIEWWRDGVNLGQTNQLSVTENVTVGTSDVCFMAVITNCAGKAQSYTTCISVDPMPLDGNIIALSPELELTSIDPMTNIHFYEICAGEDAELGVDAAAENCTRHWQYSSNLIDWLDVPLGVSNDVQNTNTLFQPDFNPVYYRIACFPESYPNSGCEPYYSDTICIMEKQLPDFPVVSGNDFICKGESSMLTISNPDPNLEYTWLCNGLEVGTGTTYQAEKEADYWVIGFDGCNAVQSNSLSLAVCEIQAAISCPLPPNECACLGIPIVLSAENSQSSPSCPGSLFYIWEFDSGSLIEDNINTVEHIPAENGTTYTLTAMDDMTGCTHTVSRTIVPCDKNK